MQPAPTPEAYKHDAFISYSRRNESFASKLEQALESYRPPKDLGVHQGYLDVFRDKADFTAGDYHQNLDKHLKDSAKLIVVCSPEARASQYVNEEITRFVEIRGVEHIIPILLSGIPNNEAKPGQEEQMAFPLALCDVMEMPLAANYLGFDAERDKITRGVFADAWYTTLANIYDISRALVEQREKKRRARTRRITYGGLSGSIVVLSILLIFALISRGQAVTARAEAETQRNVAVTARAETEVQRNQAVAARDEAESQKVAAETAREEEKKQRERAEESARQESIAKQKAVLAADLERRARIEAENNLRLATARQLAAQSGQSLISTHASVVIGADDPQRGVLLALESLNRARTPEGTRALRQALATLAGKDQTPPFVQGQTLTLKALGPGAESAVAILDSPEITDDEKGAVLIDPRTGESKEPAPHKGIQAEVVRTLAAGCRATDAADVASLKALADWLPPSESDKDLTLNADCSRLLTLDTEALEVWDVAGRKLSDTIKLGEGVVKAALGGGAWLATLSNSGVIGVWDVAAKREVVRRRAGGEFASLAVSADGSLLAAGAQDKVRVWQVKGWRRVADLPHEWSLRGMAFSSDGHWLTTVTADVSKDAATPGETALVGSTVRVWDLREQQTERRLVTQESLAAHGGITSIAFTTDGLWLAATSPAYVVPDTAEALTDAVGVGGTTLHLWQLTSDDLRRTACAQLKRNLSKSEWDTFIGTKPRKPTCLGLPIPPE